MARGGGRRGGVPVATVAVVAPPHAAAALPGLGLFTSSPPPTTQQGGQYGWWLLWLGMGGRGVRGPAREGESNVGVSEFESCRSAGFERKKGSARGARSFFFSPDGGVQTSEHAVQGHLDAGVGHFGWTFGKGEKETKTTVLRHTRIPRPAFSFSLSGTGLMAAVLGAAVTAHPLATGIAIAAGVVCITGTGFAIWWARSRAADPPDVAVGENEAGANVPASFPRVLDLEAPSLPPPLGDARGEGDRLGPDDARNPLLSPVSVFVKKLRALRHSSPPPPPALSPPPLPPPPPQAALAPTNRALFGGAIALAATVKAPAAAAAPSPPRAALASPYAVVFGGSGGGAVFSASVKAGAHSPPPPSLPTTSAPGSEDGCASEAGAAPPRGSIPAAWPASAAASAARPGGDSPAPPPIRSPPAAALHSPGRLPALLASSPYVSPLSKRAAAARGAWRP